MHARVKRVARSNAPGHLATYSTNVFKVAASIFNQRLLVVLKIACNPFTHISVCTQIGFPNNSHIFTACWTCF